jgi:hypothetical protein
LLLTSRASERAARKQPARKTIPEKSRPSGYDDAHRCVILFVQ